ncbi:MAG: zinc ribbon domain-containing protein [Gemmatimonadetes bacterium]|nr:zinc ribbon domain-containing protein [Gemmatimonadota bacterium]
MDPVVDRLHRSLVEAIRRRRSDVEAAPVTVAEIYQELVPYRVVRPTVGVELNADYEAALLRLLAGEGDRVRLEPAEARELLRRELASPNPDTGLYRRFAACEVWVRPAADSASAAPAGGDAAAHARFAPASPPEAEANAEAEPAGPGAAVAPVDPVAPVADASAARPAPAAGGAVRAPVAATDAGASCAFCREGLPVGREVRFCPHCGADQSTMPCVACGETLERGWRFCITCGAATAGPAATA